jgi:hypothetical protein
MLALATVHTNVFTDYLAESQKQLGMRLLA